MSLATRISTRWVLAVVALAAFALATPALAARVRDVFPEFGERRDSIGPVILLGDAGERDLS